MAYVHISKCGGTSIELLLYKYVQWGDVLLGSSPLGESMQSEYYKKFGLYKHSDAAQIRKVIGDILWRSYFTWSTVRNPYGRVVSLYNYARYLIEMYAHEASYPLDASLEAQRDWLVHGKAPGDREPWTYPVVQAYLRTCAEKRPFSAFIRDPALAEEPGFQPQWSFLRDPETDRQLVNEIVKLETLAAAWPPLCRRFGIPVQIVEWHNVSEPRTKLSARSLLEDAQDRAFIARTFEADFVRLGYDPAIMP